jgi:TetR/AcrR family transcriptional regulator, transcriptional repressor for nem operon
LWRQKIKKRYLAMNLSEKCGFLSCREMNCETDERVKIMSKAIQTKRYIVEKAAVLFNSKGYAGTSLDDILRATGLSKGGVYANFRNKEEIALEAFNYAVEEVNRQVRARTQGIPQVLDKLRAVVDFYQEHILNPPIAGGCPIQNTAVEADDNHERLRQHAIEVLDDWQARIVHALEKGKGRGEVCPETDSYAFAMRFIGTLEGGILMAQLYKDIRYFEAMAAQLRRMIEDLSPDE